MTLGIRHRRLPICSACSLAIFLASVAVPVAQPLNAGVATRPGEGQASTLVAPALGAHTLLGQEDQVAVSPAVTTPIATQSAGSSLLAFSAGYTSNSNGPTDNKGNNWTLLGSPVIYNGYNGAFDVKAYVSISAAGGAGHTLSIVKSGVANGELTLPFVEIRNADVLRDVARNYPTGSTTLTSPTVSTTGPATLIALWWGDGGGLQHSAVPDSGFSIIENFVNLPPMSAVQCVVAARQVTRAGSYHVSWTQTPDPGAPLWLFAFQSSDTVFRTDFEVAL
ncbi:MAG: hypothetical protein ABI411_15860 [Tahibacter sp.]